MPFPNRYRLWIFQKVVNFSKNLGLPKEELNKIGFMHIYKIIPTSRKRLVVFYKGENLIGSLTRIFDTQNLYACFGTD